MKYFRIVLLIITSIILDHASLIAGSGSGICRHMKNMLPDPSCLVSKAPIGYHVSHNTIRIDDISFASKTISGSVDAMVVSDQTGLTAVEFSLLKFNIDSIVSGNQSLVYNYNDTTITITLPSVLNLSDSLPISIYYNGNPKTDASGWGGFYFSGSFAFNLGVGFSADPHNYGRAWYPCIDEFTSRSSYDFYITTDGTSKAFCNGTLQQQVNNPNGTVTWHWNNPETIPSYLVSMAVGQYYTLTDVSSGVPVEFACLPADSNKVKSTFANLDTTVARYIDSYGPYPFSKIGYCLIPFNSGAMEHASSIHIGAPFINGSQAYATLWAHELSHMWWGDKVTCASAEDMWLNEGFASFNEAYYLEINSGSEAYTNWIRSNHRNVVQFAHTPAGDGSYLTLNNIPHSHTYGNHVYNKGASIAHTLRNFMGDSAFFTGCQFYMNNRAYNHASSYDLRDDLNAGTGVDVARFFDDWVFTPGFPHISIDSVKIIPAAFDHVYVYTRQRSKGNSHTYEISAELNLTDGINDTTVIVVIDSTLNTFHIPLLFTPTWTSLDRSLKITDAIVDYEKEIQASGNHIMSETNVNIGVITPGTNPSTVRVEHNYVKPDGFKQSNPGIRISDYHYWKFDGLIDNVMHANARFTYDGSTSFSTGYLDNTLITGTEDSLVMLYREGTWDDWEIVPGHSVITGANPNDKRGSVLVDTLKKGEYTFGYHDYTVSVNDLYGSVIEVDVIPNPSDDVFEFRFTDPIHTNIDLRIIDAGGRIVYADSIEKGTSSVFWDASGHTSGLYFAIFYQGKTAYGYSRLLLTRR